jgi:hypothetical protein
LVNGNGFSIHHVDNLAWFFPVAFIFNERRCAWLIVGVRAIVAAFTSGSGVNPMLNRICVKLEK